MPFQDATFGIVVCHLGVAAMPDRVGVFREARRVTKPIGWFVFSVFGTIHHNPIADCLQTALDEFFPADPPQFIANSVHGYADNEMIDDDLTTAGFTDAIYTTVELPFAAASAHDVATGYCLGTPLRSDLEARTSGNIKPVLRGRRDGPTEALRLRRHHDHHARAYHLRRGMSRVAVIGGGVVGLAAAIELLRDGHAVTIIEPGTPGGEQAASYGNGTLLNPSSVIPVSAPGLVEESPALPDATRSVR